MGLLFSSSLLAGRIYNFIEEKRFREEDKQSVDCVIDSVKIASLLEKLLFVVDVPLRRKTFFFRLFFRRVGKFHGSRPQGKKYLLLY